MGTRAIGSWLAAMVAVAILSACGGGGGGGGESGAGGGGGGSNPGPALGSVAVTVPNPNPRTSQRAVALYVQALVYDSTGGAFAASVQEDVDPGASTQVVTVTDVPAGTWTLRVDALNRWKHSVLSYAAPVQVDAGQTREVQAAMGPGTGPPPDQGMPPDAPSALLPTARTRPCGPGPVATALADFNRDGRVDGVSADGGWNELGRSVTVFLSTAGEPLATPVRTMLTHQPNLLAAADFTGDGVPDLAVSDQVVNSSDPWGITLLRGQGDGRFVTLQRIQLGAFPGGLKAGDFTGDGQADLAFLQWPPGNLVVLPGAGDGTFGGAIATGLPATFDLNPRALAVGDLDGDGRPDAAVSTYPGSALWVLRNTGSGAFGLAQTLPGLRTSAAVEAGDCDGDGALDLAVLSDTGAGAVWYGDGGGTFGASATFFARTAAASFALLLADLDRDGRADVVAGNQSSRPATLVCRSLSGRRFAGPEILSYASFEGPGAAADLDGDGRRDLALPSQSGQSVNLLASRAAGPFGPVRRYYSTHFQSGAPGVAVADVNGDTRPDVFLGPVDTGRVQFLAGKAGGGFEAAEALEVATSNVNFDVHLLDMNQDGLLDLVAGNDVRLGLAGGGFDISSLPGAPAPPRRRARGDFDGDGLPDFLVGSGTSLRPYLAAGNGRLDPGGSASGVPRSLEAVRAGDVTGDGVLDAMGLTDDGRVVLAPGDGNGNLGAAAEVPLPPRGSGVFRTDLELADLDGDGNLDLALAQAVGASDVTLPDGTPDNLLVLPGNGDGTFGGPEVLACGRLPRALLATDLDGDGTADLVAANGYSTSLTLHLSGGGTPVRVELPHSIADSDLAVRVADATGDGRPDLLVGSKNVFALLPGL